MIQDRRTRPSKELPLRTLSALDCWYGLILDLCVWLTFHSVLLVTFPSCCSKHLAYHYFAEHKDILSQYLFLSTLWKSVEGHWYFGPHWQCERDDIIFIFGFTFVNICNRQPNEKDGVISFCLFRVIKSARMKRYQYRSQVQYGVPQGSVLEHYFLRFACYPWEKSSGNMGLAFTVMLMTLRSIFLCGPGETHQI